MRPLSRFRPNLDWDPRFGEDDPLFDSVRAAAERVRGFRTWPSVAQIDGALRDLVPVRFVPQPPKPRRRRAPIDASALYDGRITIEGVVPTREQSWHDLLNALVWASFPKTKRALHARQYALARARIGETALRIPGARSREEDRLAMLDEGGAVTLTDGETEARLVFGHAILEHRIAGIAGARPHEITIRVHRVPDRRARMVCDELLSRRLEA